MPDTLNFVPQKLESVSLQMEIFGEIRRLLAPYQATDAPISGDTVICDGTKVDSLTIMDMVMELEDRFEVSIPMNRIAEIRTVDELADTILGLAIR